MFYESCRDVDKKRMEERPGHLLSLIHISEPTRHYTKNLVCRLLLEKKKKKKKTDSLKKKKQKKQQHKNSKK